MNPISKLRQAFENDTRGFIYARQLHKLARSNLLIQEIAQHYGYYPVYSRNSYHPTGYKHHTLIQNTQEMK